MPPDCQRRCAVWREARARGAGRPARAVSGFSAKVRTPGGWRRCGALLPPFAPLFLLMRVALALLGALTCASLPCRGDCGLAKAAAAPYGPMSASPVKRFSSPCSFYAVSRREKTCRQSIICFLALSMCLMWDIVKKDGVRREERGRAHFYRLARAAPLFFPFGCWRRVCRAARHWPPTAWPTV